MSSVISLDFSFAVEIISPWLGSISIALLVKKEQEKEEKEKKKRDWKRKIGDWSLSRERSSNGDRDFGIESRKVRLFGPIGPFIRR